MPLTKKQKDSIKEKLYTVLRNKFRDYKPETTSMTFHTRLLGKDRMALYSFIQSLNTNFGTSIFEPLAVELGKDRFKIIDKQVAAKDIITSEAQIVIQNIMDVLLWVWIIFIIGCMCGMPERETVRLWQVCCS